MNNEIAFIGFTEDDKKRYKVFGYDLIIRFTDDMETPYLAKLQCCDDSKWFKTEEDALKWATKYAKKEIKKEIKKRPLIIAYNNKRAKWESEYQDYTNEKEKIIINER